MNPNSPSTPPTAHSGEPTPDAPKPTFDALPLTAEVRKAIDEMGYLNPTPVQIAVFDPIVRGKDVKVQARTGTGKTTAFGLPIVDQLVRKTGGLQALVLCPTRELALQVGAEVAKLGKHKGIKICAVYGGAPMGRQIAELEEGAQVVVGTPGRVLDHLRRGTMDASQIRVFVLDEADEMLSMGFEKELNAIVERLPASRQTMLFSATLSSDVGRLARSMKDPETILLSGDQVGALELTHYFYMQQGDKTRDLLRVLEVEDPTSAILFCNTKDETERTAKELRRAGFAADYLSGDLDQKDREKVMNAVREGKLRFLVATDVAARGIDISHLTHVINVDFPDSAEQYVHRTGRTGRAGRTGTAISLINAKDVGNLYYLRLTYGLRPIERTLPTEQELQTRRETDLVDKVAAKVRDRTIDVDARAVARRLLTRDDAETLVAALLRDALGSHVVAAEEAARARRGRTSPAAVEPPPPSSLPTTRAEPRARPQPKPPEKAPEKAPEKPQDKPFEPVQRAPLPNAPPPQPIDSPVDSEAITARRRDRERGRERGPDRDRGDRGDRGERGDRDRDRGRPPHSKLVEWSPPEEADDEAPILTRGEERAPTERPVLEEVKTVFVNSGRRDGLRASDVVKILEERGQISVDAIGRVRVRDRNSFVDVRPDVIDKAIEAIKGATVGSRTLNAELARPKGGAGEESPEPFDERSTLPMGSRR